MNGTHPAPPSRREAKQGGGCGPCSGRTVAAELRAAGCTEEEIGLFLLVQRTSRRRERARRVERLARALGAALARIVLWPAEVLLPGR